MFAWSCNARNNILKVVLTCHMCCARKSPQFSQLQRWKQIICWASVLLHCHLRIYFFRLYCHQVIPLITGELPAFHVFNECFSIWAFFERLSSDSSLEFLFCVYTWSALFCGLLSLNFSKVLQLFWHWKLLLLSCCTLHFGLCHTGHLGFWQHIQ